MRRDVRPSIDACIFAERVRPVSFELAWRGGEQSSLHALNGELLVERIAVICAVSDHALGCRLHESLGKGIADELCFMSLTTSNPNGDR